MNIAFQAFLLFLVFFPGLLFMLTATGRIAHDREFPVLSTSITGQTALALLISAVFHSVWELGIFVMSLHPQIPFKPSAEHFFTLLSSGQQTSEFREADRYVGGSLGYMSLYFLSICCGSLGAGWLAYYLIKRMRLYQRYEWLRFKPRWHYLLSGEIVEAEIPDEISVYADILTEVEGKPLLYSGFIYDYWFDKDTGALDVILLEEAWRLSLTMHPARTGSTPSIRPTGPQDIPTEEDIPTDEVNFDTDQTEIPGDTLAIKYSEVKNINIQYIVISLPNASSEDFPAVTTVE